MKAVSLYIVALIGLLPACSAATHYECSNARSRWDYWWWSASDPVLCPPRTSCTTNPGGGRTIPWDITQGPSVTFSIAEQASKQFSGSHSYAQTAKWTNTLSYTVQPGATVRLWLKQWYVVSDVDCKACTDIGTCSKSQQTTIWVPCTNGDCVEWELSDANGRCDSGNHCTI